MRGVAQCRSHGWRNPNVHSDESRRHPGAPIAIAHVGVRHVGHMWWFIWGARPGVRVMVHVVVVYIHIKKNLYIALYYKVYVETTRAAVEIVVRLVFTKTVFIERRALGWGGLTRAVCGGVRVTIIITPLA